VKAWAEDLVPNITRKLDAEEVQKETEEIIREFENVRKAEVNGSEQ